jgi:hypothetical protein
VEIPRIHFHEPGDPNRASAEFVAELEDEGADDAFVVAVREAATSEVQPPSAHSGGSLFARLTGS